MGHIKEPSGVDFSNKSRPLTEDEKIAISKYIREYKVKHSKGKGTQKKKGRKVTSQDIFAG